MTDIHDALREIESTDVFAIFGQENPDHYLVHAFCHVRQGHGSLELGFYGRKTDKITVFTTNPVEARPPEAVFKESGTLPELDIQNVKLGLQDARDVAEAYRAEAYPAQQPIMQEICILQQMDAPIWNITFVLGTLNMLNMKIHAGTGEILDEHLRNIMDLRANTGE